MSWISANFMPILPALPEHRACITHTLKLCGLCATCGNDEAVMLEVLPWKWERCPPQVRWIVPPVPLRRKGLPGHLRPRPPWPHPRGRP